MKRWAVFWILLVFVASCGIGDRRKEVILQPQKTGITTLRYYDHNRKRPLVTEVWYPVDESVNAQPVKGLWVRCPEARDAPIKETSKKYPLVVMSHGNGGDRLNVAWLAEILASNGFIVAAMDHHGNTWNNKIAECFIKIWERPVDVSFIIDEVIKDPKFASKIDASKIGFIGYSLGGQTGIWIAGGQIGSFDTPRLSEIPAGQIPSIVTPDILDAIDFSPVKQSYRDPRVAAAFLMAPALVNLFDWASLQAIQIPVYIVAPEGDQIVPFETNAKVLAQHVRQGAFKLISGPANHYVFLNEVSKGGSLMLDKSVVQDPPNVDRKQIHEEIGLAAVEFFTTHLCK